MQIDTSVRHRGVPDVPQDVDYLMEHLNDPNFDYYSESRSLSDSSTQVFDLETKKVSDAGEFDMQSRSDSVRYSTASKTESDFEYNDESPYPEVRAAVSSVDDPTMPVGTFRAWFLGLFFSILIASLNQLFSMRYPAVYISNLVVQLLALPCGKLLERILPTARFNTLGCVWTLNPGPFNIKEHVLITLMAGVATSGAYVTDVFATQRFFYNQSVGIPYQLLLAVSTQLFGFSLGGFLSRFLVYPSSMIWPGALVNSALFNTLHRTYGKPDRHISRHKFFLLVAVCSFTWYFIPGFLWTGLSVFNWACWIAPTNTIVNALFGTSSGLGMGILTFDWAQVAFFSNPLISPWWAEANTGIGFVIVFWIIVPILYFTNGFYTGYLPISSSSTFDNTGMPYDPSQVVTNGTFDITKYEAYSPVFLPATLAIAYGIAFATFTSLIVHFFLWYRRDIVKRFTNNFMSDRDVHWRLMQAYPQVPQWWYLALGAIMTIFMLVSVEIFPTQLPIWAVFLALILSIVVTIPSGIIQAITNQQVALNVMYEFLAGYLVPGKPVAVMVFKAIGFTGTNQAIGFAADMKLCHYMKIPPRLMFTGQVASAIVTCFVVVFVQEWMFSNIVDICQPHQPQFFTCPSTSVFASASLIWGGVGPQRIFNVGQLYGPILWFFAIGAILPIPFYYLARRYPLSYWRYINIPVIFAGLGSMPPATGINYASWLLVGFIFQWFMRRYHFRWWMRYNYILAVGLDSGLAISLVFIFLFLQLPKGGVMLNWWGNTAWQNTADALGTPHLAVPPGGTFGPSTW